MAKMSESEWKAFLVEKPRTGKLGTVRKDGRPHVAPIWFDLDDDGTILFMTGTHTVKGRAIRGLEVPGRRMSLGRHRLRGPQLRAPLDAACHRGLRAPVPPAEVRNF
jgi:hypothetical protein